MTKLPAMQIIEDISELEDPCKDRLDSLTKAWRIAPNFNGRARYYLMQQDFNGIDKKLLKFCAFSSKADFHTWRTLINTIGNGRLVEWTAGFLFKFYGDDHHYTLVDKNGKEPKLM